MENLAPFFSPREMKLFKSHDGQPKAPLRELALDGIEYDDDWLVIWRGLNVGRILKQLSDAPSTT